MFPIQALFFFAICWQAANSLFTALELDKKVRKSGESMTLALAVDPKNGVVCIVYFGDGDCAMVLDDRMLNVQQTETKYGVAKEHVYKTAGTFEVKLFCEANGTTSTNSSTSTVAEDFGGLKQISDQQGKIVKLKALDGYIEGTVNFTFDAGSLLQGEFTTDENISGNVVIDEVRKTGYVAFSVSDFKTYGEHEINVTVYNIYNNSNFFFADIEINNALTFLTIVLVEEKITALTLDAPEYSIVNSTINMTAKVRTGSKLNFWWTCSGGVSCWDVANGTAYAHAFTTPGEYDITVSVSNVLDTKNKTQTHRVLLPVSGFFIYVQREQLTTHESLFLDHPGDIENMGELFINITDQDYIVTKSQAKLDLVDFPTVVFQSLPAGNLTLDVTIFNILSVQKLNTTANIRPKEPVPPFSVHSESEITLPDGIAVFTVQSLKAHTYQQQTMCVVKFKDSSPSKILSFNNILKNPIQHGFVKGGVFNVTFECSNDISSETGYWVINVVAFTAADFEFSYPKLLSRNSTNQTSEVTFNIELLGLSKPPKGVHIEWDFGDGSQPMRFELLFWTFRHSFRKRGQFGVVARVLTDWGDNYTTDLPVRIGIISVTVFPTEGKALLDIISINISSFSGSPVHYELDFGDGTSKTLYKETNDENPIQVSKVYDNPGHFRLRVIAMTDTFTEVYSPPTVISINETESITGMSLLIDDIIRLPPGKTDMILSLNTSSSVPPNTYMWCVFEFGDGSPHEEFVFEAQLQTSITHAFSAVGMLTVRGNCSFDNETIIQAQNQTNVVSQCYGSSKPFSNLNPLIKSTASERLTLAARPDIVCVNMTPEFVWRVETSGTTLDIPQPNSSLFVVPPRSMRPGRYRIVFFTNFIEIPTIFISDSVIVEYEATPLQASIKGGTYKTFGRTQPVVLDAMTHSYDPDVEVGSDSGLEFSWSCSTYDSSTEAYQSLSQPHRDSHSCVDAELSSSGLLVLVPQCLLLNKWHKFSVTVQKDNRTSQSYQIVHIVGRPLQVDMRCKVNCLDKVNAEFSLSLVTECLDCSRVELQRAIYRWSLYRSNTMDNPRQRQIPLDHLSSTGINISTISIRSNSLIPGQYYSLECEITGIENRSTQSLGYDFMVNLPPYNGTCVLTPEEGVAVLDKFRVECRDWVDEGYKLKRSQADHGEFLIYQYILKANNKSSVLFSGGSRMTSWQELNPGDKDDDYRIIITARIFDRHKGVTERNMTGRVTLPVPDSNKPITAAELDNTIKLFEEKLSQAAVGKDAHQVFRTSEAASSVLNSLRLNDTSKLPDTQSQWLAAETPDQRRINGTGNDMAASWEDIWTTLIKPEKEDDRQKIIKTNRGYAQRVASVVNETKSYSISTVHMAATSVSSLVSSGMVDDDGLEAAVDTMSTVGGSLTSAVDTEISDVQIKEVLSSVVDSVDHSLSAMLKEQPVEEDLSSAEETRKALKRRRSYIVEDDGVEGESDLNEDERVFVITRISQRQAYKFDKQRRMTKSKLPSLLQVVDKALDVVSGFLVDGQEAATFQSSNIIVSVERNMLHRILERENKLSDVTAQISYGNDTTINPTQRVTLKKTIHQKNPYVFGRSRVNGGITSRIIRLQMTVENATDEDSPPFVSSGSLTFTLPNSEPVILETVVPKYIALDHDQMLYHKTELKSRNDNIVLYLKPSTEKIVYDVYFRSGEFPTALAYDYKTTVRFLDQNSLRLTSVRCPAGVLPSNGTVYVGLKPTVLEPQIDLKGGAPETSHVLKLMEKDSANYSAKMHSQYDLGITTVGCRTWDDILDLWNPDICLMIDTSSDKETRCKCEQSSFASFTMGTTFYVPVNTIDFSTVFTQIDLRDNSGVLGVILSLLFIYALLSIWARRKDKRDMLKMGVTGLKDNRADDKYLYMVTVYTGMRLRAGTQSRVGFVMAGDLADTGIRVLSDGIRNGLERQSITHYLMAVPGCLGDLQYIRVWHDNSGKGSEASWFAHKFIVEDIQCDQRFVFHCGRWLAVDEDDGMIERLFPVSSNQCRSFRKVFYNSARKNVSDNHLWFSVLLRPQRSTFTRFQRLSSCFCFLLLTMISNALFFHSEENIVRPTSINIGFLRFSLHQLYVSVIGSLIVTPVSVFIVALFTKSKPSPNILQTNNGTCLPSPCSNSGVEEDQRNLASALVAKGFYNPKTTTLPHFCMYIAWAILILSSATSLFFLFLYSQQWGKAKSEEWITSFLLSFFESLFVVDPLKVILIALFMALFVRKPDDGATDGLSKEVKSHSMDVGEKTAQQGKHSQRETLSPLTEDQLGPIRARKKKETKAFEVLKEIFLYLIFLLVMYTLGYTNRDPRSFNSRDNIYNMMVYKQNDRRPGLLNVITTSDVYNWLNFTALPALFHEQYYNGSRRSSSDRYYMKDLQNFRVGPPRLRQMRGAQLRDCPMHFVQLSMCNTPYSMNNGESRDFCVGWKEQPCPDDERITKFTSAAWEFTPASDSWGMPVFGRFNSYAGGGYIAELDVNRNVSLAMLNELHSNLWIDRQTRALALEFTVYNANSNIFCYVTLLVEFPETGGTMRQAFVAPFRIYQHVGALGSYILLNEILFLVFLVFAIVHFSLKLRKYGFSYMQERWHILDFLCIVASLVGIAMYGVREVMAEYSLARLHDDPRRFVDFHHITIWDEVMVDIIGVVSSIVTVRTLNILGYSRRVNAITRVLTNASRELFFFSIIFFIVFLAFVVLGYMLFGTELEAYHTFLITCSTLMTSMIGKTPFDEMRRAEPLLAQAYFALFVFFVVLVLLTMFLAILNDSIAVVRAADKERGADSSQQEMLMMLLMKFRESLSLFFPSLAEEPIISKEKGRMGERTEEPGTISKDLFPINEISNKTDLMVRHWSMLYGKRKQTEQKTTRHKRSTPYRLLEEKRS